MGLRVGDMVVTVRPTMAAPWGAKSYPPKLRRLRRGQRLCVSGFTKSSRLWAILPDGHGKVLVSIADIVLERRREH